MMLYLTMENKAVVLMIAFATVLVVAADVSAIRRIKHSDILPQCTCNDFICECCVKFEKPFCAQLNLNVTDFMLGGYLKIDKEIIGNFNYGPDSLPVCVPVQSFLGSTLCFMLDRVHVDKNSVKVCPSFQARALMIKIFDSKFRCLEFKDGKLSTTNSDK